MVMGQTGSNSIVVFMTQSQDMYYMASMTKGLHVTISPETPYDKDPQCDILAQQGLCEGDTVKAMEKCPGTCKEQLGLTSMVKPPPG